jgi:hypothetical protein
MSTTETTAGPPPFRRTLSGQVVAFDTKRPRDWIELVHAPAPPKKTAKVDPDDEQRIYNLRGQRRQHAKLLAKAMHKDQRVQLRAEIAERLATPAPSRRVRIELAREHTAALVAA